MAHSVRTETFRLACSIAGGPRKLKELLQVPISDVISWVAGTKEPPEPAFLQALTIVLDDLDAGGGGSRKGQDDAGPNLTVIPKAPDPES
jgi:hypothetical protein